MRLDSWHRLEQVVKWTGLSVNSFALTIGLKRSENLYQIKKGNNGISRDLADQITAKYTTLSKGWLLTGEGEMFIDTQPTSGIPFYGEDAVAVVQIPSGERPMPNYYIQIPPLNDCHLAALSTGVAMQPDVPAGAIVMLQRADKHTIIPGETYLVICEHFKGMRVIRCTENPNELLLVPSNTEAYDPMTITRESIIMLYRMRGVISTKN